MAFKPYAPREPGTLHKALSRAIDELGSNEKAADVIGRTPGWLTDASNPHRTATGKAGHLTYAEARTMTRAGATALAEDLALLCGGVLLPPVPATAPGCFHAALSAIVREHAEAVSEMIQRASDGVICVADAKVGLELIDDALRAMTAGRALLQTVIDTGEALK